MAVAEPTGALDVALAHTARLLRSSPELAAAQAGEILKAVPNHPVACLHLGAARRSLGEFSQALDVLRPLAAAQPKWALAHLELGLTLAQAGYPNEALGALRTAVSFNATLPDAWRVIGDLLAFNGDIEGADAAYAQHIKAGTRDPRLLAPAAALVEGRIAVAEKLLKTHLMQFPTDVSAIRMLAEVAARLGRNADSETLLERCLELAPSFAAARNQYAIILHRQNKYAAALRQIDMLLQADPHNSAYSNTRAVVLGKIGEYRESLEIYDKILSANPHHEKIWLSYGHALATAGRQQDSIAAYRRGIALKPELGEAYWSLANLKTFRFQPAEIAGMRQQLARSDLAKQDRFHLDFALGKALEDAGEYADSFEHYRKANQLRRTTVDYDAEETTAFVARSTALFDREFFESRAHYGSAAADPIFVVGMPRAGSTLLEQILSSHSCVEGTMELPDIVGMAALLAGQPKKNSTERPYPGVLASLSAQDCRELGDKYIAQTRIQRKSQKPFFIDKLPNNFLHIGLIHLILPNAKIIDARRHPLDCCFSGFKMQFADGHRYSYDLGEIGGFYRNYVRYMQHIDSVLPGRVHRAIYERVVEDTEAEVRRLLAYCGLPFEESCLKFYENARPVRTASAQQVRVPIFKDGMDRWRRYEAWLGPLKTSLGDVLDTYPGTREF